MDGFLKSLADEELETFTKEIIEELRRGRARRKKGDVYEKKEKGIYL